MAEEQSTEPDGYYAPSEEELLCPKPKFPKLATAEREVSIMEEEILSEDNMLDIVNKIYTTRSKWYYIGLQLKIPVYILDGINSEPTSVHLDKMVQYWLAQTNPRPTWRALANSLRKSTVGEGRLAEEIERQCCYKENTRAVNEIDGSKDTTAGSLGIDDLGTVLEALHDNRSKWRHLGTQLKVSNGTLESISQDCSDDQARLCQVLKHWLRSSSTASWDDLTVALENQEGKLLVLPPQPSHKCQPRQVEVEQLHLMFKDLREKNGTDKVVTLYIVGLPAFGKTTLASLFAEDYYKRNKKQVFVGFIDATSRATLLESCCTLLYRATLLESYCTLANETGLADVVREVRLLSGPEKELQGLQLLVPLVKKELKSQKKWLLVIDNLTSDVKPLQSYKRSTAPSPSAPWSGRQSDWVMFIPQPGDCSLGEGHILVTTQEGKLVEKASDYARKFRLNEGMSPSDAVGLLELISGLKDSELALHVVETLHRIPLSIAAAGYYVQLERDQRNEHYSYKEYLDALRAGVQEQSEELLAEENRNYSQTLNFALDMCVNQQASNHNLYRVFILMSFCAHTPVPMRVIANLLDQNADMNSSVMQNVRDCALLQTSTVKIDGEPVEMVSLHQATWQLLCDKLLITVTKDHAQKPDRTVGCTSFSTDDVPTIFQKVTEIFVAQYPHILRTVVTNVKYYETLQPHLESFTAWTAWITLDPVHEFHLHFHLGQNYEISIQPAKAIRAYEHAVKIAHSCSEQRWKQSTDPEIVAIYLGNLYSHFSQEHKAEGILKTVLASLQKKCGENGAEVAQALQGLGLAYDKLQLYDKSLHCYERAIAVEKIINPVAPDTAGLNIDIGCLFMSKGDYRKSITYFEKAIAEYMRNRPPGYANSGIIKAVGYIGNAHILLGELEQGIRAREKSLHFTEELYGLRHPRCVGISTKLSFSYLRQGNFSKSITFAKKAESTLQLHNTFEHGTGREEFTYREKADWPYHFWFVAYLAPVIAIHGQFQAAEEYLSKAVKCLSNMGQNVRGGIFEIFPPVVAALCGKTAGAQRLVQQSLEIDPSRKKSHIHLQLTSFQVQLELGRYAEGQELLAVIEGLLDSEGKGEVASDLLSLLTVPDDLECIWESAGAIHEYLRIIQSFLCSSVPLSEYFNIIHEGFKAFRLKEFCKAEQCFSEILARDSKEAHGQPNLVSLDTMRMYGTSLFHQDKLPEATKCLEECLSNAKSLCSNHPLVGKISYTLAQVYHGRGQKELAVPRLKEALASFESSYQEHPLMATIAAQLTNS